MQWVQGWSTTENWIDNLCHIGHTEMKYSGCKVGPPQRAGSSICINWLHRNEMQWMHGWPTTESWIEHLYNIGYTEMKCSGCKVGQPQRAGSSICIALGTPKWNAVGAELVHHRGLDRAFVLHWLHRHEMQCVQSWSTTENWIEHLYYIWLHWNDYHH